MRHLFDTKPLQNCVKFHNTIIFIWHHAFDNALCKMATILFTHQCVNKHERPGVGLLKLSSLISPLQEI